MNKERIDRLFEILNLGNVDEDKMIQEFQDFFQWKTFIMKKNWKKKWATLCKI